MPLHVDVRRYLEELVEKHDWFLDPFSCDVLSISEHSLKIVLTLESDEAALSQRQSMDEKEDNLLPVFYVIASKLFPSGFDFRSNRRVLVVGGPSCGKSTLLKHMAVLCASQQTKRQFRNSSYIPFIPIIVPMRRLIDFAEDARFDLIAGDLLADFLALKHEKDFAKQQLLLKIVSMGNFWLLLDGLDEVVDKDSRAQFTLDCIESISRKHLGVRIVMTSRDGVSCKAQMNELGFCTLRMRPLTTDLAENIVTKHLCGNRASEFFSKESLPEWLKSELRRPRFKLFRKSPMTLMLLVNVLQDLDNESKRDDSIFSRQKLSPSPRNLLRSKSLPRINSFTIEEEEAIKKSCQGRDLMPPYSRIDLFKRAISRLLRWRPIEEKNKTSCNSPVQRTGQPLRVNFTGSRKAFCLDIPPLTITPIESLQSPRNASFKNDTETKLVQLLRTVAYLAHEQQSREIRLQDFKYHLDKFRDSDGDLVSSVDGLVERIKKDQAPLFTIEDRDDYIEEETLEQQQHQRQRQPNNMVVSQSPDSLRAKGVVLFIHQSIQDHLAAEYIAELFLKTAEDMSVLRENAVEKTIDGPFFEEKEGASESKGEPLTESSVEESWTVAPKRYSVQQGRSRSVFSTSMGIVSKLTQRTPRRASILGTGNFSVDYSDETLISKIRELVERYILGHFEQSSYRIALEWWQPTILSVFEILADKAPRPSKDDGPTLFDTVLRAVVERCTRMQSYNNGRAPACLESFWLSAAAFGNVMVAKGLLRHLGVRTMLQATNEEWNNAMHLAAVNNQPEIIKLLMAEDEVDTEYLDRNNRHGWDPSNMAMVFNHTYCFRLLCCTDGDKVAENDELDRRPPLLDASMRGDAAKVREILLGVDSEAEDSDADTCDEEESEEANKNQQLESTGIPSQPEIVLPTPRSHRRSNSRGSTSGDKENGKTVNRHELNRTTSTGSHASSSGKKRRPGETRRYAAGLGSLCSSSGMLCRRIRKKACDVNAKGSSGMTAAMWAARNGHVEVLDELIKHGANISEAAQGISALIFAVESGHVDCVKLLIDNGADPLSRTPDDDSSLLCSCSFGYDEVAKVLIEAGASALEALVVSCVQGKDATVRSLVENGLVNVNEVWNDLMVTPLAGACVAGHLSTVRLLLALGADPNVSIDVEYGSTPLMLACHMGNIEVVQVMLDAGSDPNARTPPSSQCAQANGANTTAVSIAKLNGHIEVERLLRRYGAKEHVPTDFTFYEWLGGHVRYPHLSPDFESRRRLGMEVSALLDEDEYYQRVDLSAWQWLGGRTAGERAWEPRNADSHQQR